MLGLFVESGLRSFFVNAVDWMKLMNVYVSMGVTPPQSMPPGAKPALANRNRAKSLSREPEMQHVAVLDDVVLALET